MVRTSPKVSVDHVFDREEGWDVIGLLESGAALFVSWLDDSQIGGRSDLPGGFLVPLPPRLAGSDDVSPVSKLWSLERLFHVDCDLTRELLSGGLSGDLSGSLGFDLDGLGGTSDEGKSSNKSLHLVFLLQISC